MNIICSPSGIVNPFRPEQGVTDISNAGFENISLEFDMCCSAYELENYGTERINKDDSGYPEGWDIRSVLRHPEEIGRFYENLISSIRAKDLSAEGYQKTGPKRAAAAVSRGKHPVLRQDWMQIHYGSAA